MYWSHRFMLLEKQLMMAQSMCSVNSLRECSLKPYTMYATTPFGNLNVKAGISNPCKEQFEFTKYNSMSEFCSTSHFTLTMLLWLMHGMFASMQVMTAWQWSTLTTQWSSAWSFERHWKNTFLNSGCVVNHSTYAFTIKLILNMLFHTSLPSGPLSRIHENCMTFVPNSVVRGERGKYVRWCLE